MARTRRTSNASRTRTKAPLGTAEFTCPECGKTFPRAASLGAHRSRSHGVSGKKSKTAATSGSSSQRAGGRGTTTRGNSDVRRRRNRAPERQRVDRDALLQALFPNGVPAREAVIRAANAWLNDAEQLAKMR